MAEEVNKNIDQNAVGEHQHEWQRVIIEYDNYFMKEGGKSPIRCAVIASYCKGCGKLSRIGFSESVKGNGGTEILSMKAEDVELRHPELDVYGVAGQIKWFNKGPVKMKLIKKSEIK